MATDDSKLDIVLEGGGVKGIGLVGAVARLQQDFTIQRVAGTSVGALVGALVAAGYTGEELEEALFAFPFEKVKRCDRLDRVPFVGPAVSLAVERGVYETTFVRDHLDRLLQDKGVTTFGDLAVSDPDSALSAGHRYRLVVTATDVSSGELLYLPWDYSDRFGLDPDEQRVADAVAASIAIPFFFEPVTLADDTGREHVLVDGGVLSNFPIGVFDRTDSRQPRWPTFGLKIIPHLPEGTSDLFPFVGLLPIPGVRHLEAVVATALVGRDQTYLAQPCVAARTIQIDAGAAGIVEFDLGDDQKHELRDQGWQDADDFLSTWDWSEYLATCRRP